MKSIAGVVCSIAILFFLYWLTSPPAVEFIIGILFFTGLFFLFSYINMKLLYVPLASYIVSGAQDEVVTKLHHLLQEEGFSQLRLNIKKSRITFYGISHIVQRVARNRYGDVIEATVRMVTPRESEVDVIGRTSILSRSFYSQQELARDEFDVYNFGKIIRRLAGTVGE